MSKPTHKKVFVGMSGGVDSSVSAYLLKKEGYEVTGIHLICWNEGGCSDKEERDARRVTQKLDIPFVVLDLRKEYADKVVGYMVDGYKKGITPNPDVMCNKEIKFGVFLKKALEMGADYVATGHYTRIQKRGGVYSIYAGKDKNKDQSYFLWTLTQDQLKHTLFPLGEMEKPEVRRIAKKIGLHIADKKDSQGVCFVGKISLQEFLSRYLEEKEGRVLDTRGKAVGFHPGAYFYTVGQRHGLGVALNEPHYIASTDVKTNTVVLAEAGDRGLYRTEVILKNLNLNPNFEFPADVKVRIRYRQGLQSARIKKTKGGARLVFKKPVRSVAPGQSAVFYNSRGGLLGGGVIIDSN